MTAKYHRATSLHISRREETRPLSKIKGCGRINRTGNLNPEENVQKSSSSEHTSESPEENKNGHHEFRVDSILHLPLLPGAKPEDQV